MEKVSVEDGNRSVVFGELLRQILGFISTPDLIHSVRLVSKFWNNVATDLCRRERSNAKITFEFSTIHGQFLLRKSVHDQDPVSAVAASSNSQNVYRNCKTLTQFRKFLAKDSSKKRFSFSCRSSAPFFPVTRFRFEGGNPGRESDVLKFFKVWGNNILGLEIGDFEPDSVMKYLTDLFSSQVFIMVPNLRSLGISESVNRTRVYSPVFQTEGQGQNPQQRPTALQHLRHVDFGFYSWSPEVICLFIDCLKPVFPDSFENRGIVRIEFLRFFSAPLLHKLSPYNIHISKLMHSIKMPLSVLRDVADLAIHQKLRTRRLILFPGSPSESADPVLKKSEFLFKFLGNQGCLEKLTLNHGGDCIMFFKDILPLSQNPFPHLKSLKILFQECLSACQSTLGALSGTDGHSWSDLDALAPNICSIKVQTPCPGPCQVCLGFLRTANKRLSGSVKKLSMDLRSSVDVEFMKSWLKLLPAVEYLSLKVLTNFEGVAREIWAAEKIEHIKKLKIVMGIDPSVWSGNCFPYIDMLMTGLSEETVRILNSKTNGNGDLVLRNCDYEAQPRFPPKSLLGLETFILGFHHCSTAQEDELCMSPKVTGPYLFNQMPTVRFRIYVRAPNKDLDQHQRLWTPFTAFENVTVHFIERLDQISTLERCRHIKKVPEDVR